MIESLLLKIIEAWLRHRDNCVFPFSSGSNVHWQNGTRYVLDLGKPVGRKIQFSEGGLSAVSAEKEPVYRPIG